jgi:hypothetical protein
MGLLCFSEGMRASVGRQAAIVEPLVQANQVWVPGEVPAVSIYKVTNITGASNVLRTSNAPSNVAFDHNYMAPDGTHSCLLDNQQTLAPNETCMIKMDISGAVLPTDFHAQFGFTVGTLRIHVHAIPEPTEELQHPPSLEIGSSNSNSLQIQNPSSGNIIANNVQIDWDNADQNLKDQFIKAPEPDANCFSVPSTGCIIKFFPKEVFDEEAPSHGTVMVRSANTKATILELNLQVTPHHRHHHHSK